MSDYEDCLRRARAEGWRDPISVTNLEIKAYEQGLLIERNRILLLLSDVADGRPMRAIDLQRYFERIKNPNKMV
jgi:hypothetical protein